MIERIDHLSIVVTNLERAEKFFAEFGMQPEISSDLDPAFLERVTGIKSAAGRFTAMRLPGSTLTLELQEFSSPPPPAADPHMGEANRLGFRHVAFAVQNIEAVVDGLKKRGVDFVSSIQTWEKTGKKLVYFYGPDGILLELAQYPE